MPGAENLVAAGLHVVGLSLVAMLGAGLLQLAVNRQANVAQGHVIMAFVLAWLLMYGASVAYHLAPGGWWRALLMALDKGAIFAVIAAGWAIIAPFRLPPVQAAWTVGILWALALVGLAVEVAATWAGGGRALRGFADAVYLTQAVAPLVIYGRGVFRTLSRPSLIYLFGGFVAYGIGFVFYRMPSDPWNHVYWHAMIIVGCLLNFGGVRQLLRELQQSPAFHGPAASLATNAAHRHAAMAMVLGYMAASVPAHLAWEIAQLPLYEVWVAGSVSDQIHAVLHGSMGDVMVALLLLGAAILVLRAWRWPSARFLPVVCAVTLIGIAYILFSEWLNVEWRGTWAYAAAMPRIPWLGTGVTPLLQWLLLPPLCLLVARRLVGRTALFGAVS